MSNLLDKASIILTPTAYNNGEALCVKPSDGSGDFDFSRNSAATRVNAQGLVENVQILSSNLVQNGDFSEEGVQEVSNGSFSQEGAELVTNGDFATDSNWNKGSGWSISGGKATSDGTQVSASYLSQTLSGISQGKQYITEFDIDVISGSFRFNTLGNNLIVTESGHYVIYSTSVSGITLYLEAQVGFTGSIDNVSVREVGQDWTLGTGWSIGEDKAIATSTANSISIYQNNTVEVGKTYKVTYTVADYVEGGIYVRVGSGVNGVVRFGNGTYTEYITQAGDNKLYLTTYTTTTLSITNISVKEVGQNWSVSNSDANNYVEFGDGTARLKFLNVSPITQLMATAPYVSGKKYKLIVDVASVTSGSIKVANAGIDETFDTVGISTRIINPTGTSNIEFYRASADVDITLNSVSLIEITDDTNLPRINYEGFSYQDALGSEEIVNGDFSNGLTNWTTYGNTSVSNGVATIGASGNSGIYQAILNQNKSYKVTINVTAYNGVGQAQIANDNGFVLYTINGLGEQSFIFEHTIPQLNLIIRGLSNALFSIDNVSVKEYLGQEVVPDSGCGSWLWEPQSTNLITQSELFSDAYWTKNGVSVLGGFTSPSGDLSAFKLVENTSSVHVIYNPSNAFSSLTDASYSIFVKYSGRQWVRLFCEFGTTSYNSWFDILNGVTGTSSADISDIQDYGNGWFKITQTNSLDAINGRYRLYLADADNSTTYTGDGVSGVYIWGAQAENQSYATSYIPTSGSTVTRNQDVCINGATGTGLINSTEGVLYAEIARSEEENLYRLLGIDDGTSNNYVKMGFENSRGAFWIRAVINGVTSISSDNALTSNPNEFYKIAIRYQSGNSAIYINGTSVLTTTTTFSSGNFTALDFNHWNNSLNFFGKTKALAVWKEALSDEELTELTTI